MTELSHAFVLKIEDFISVEQAHLPRLGQGSESSYPSLHGTARHCSTRELCVSERERPTSSTLQNSNHSQPTHPRALQEKLEAPGTSLGLWSMNFHSDINPFLMIRPRFSYSWGAEGCLESRKGTHITFNLQVPSHLAHINLSRFFFFF